MSSSLITKQNEKVLSPELLGHFDAECEKTLTNLESLKNLEYIYSVGLVNSEGISMFKVFIDFDAIDDTVWENQMMVATRWNPQALCHMLQHRTMPTELMKFLKSGVMEFKYTKDGSWEEGHISVSWRINGDQQWISWFCFLPINWAEELHMHRPFGDEDFIVQALLYLHSWVRSQLYRKPIELPGG